MVCDDTLRVRNFPSSLSGAEIENFLKHFGASEVKIITSKLKQRTIAFAQFESTQIAKTVLHRIHQLKLLDSYLCVEFAQNDIAKDKNKLKSVEIDDYKHKRHYKQFITRINAFNNSVSFNQPPPSHLKYVYPKPNCATINNIAHALASVPKFYTQVLHLMNRMNLPPPFSDVPDPPQITRVQTQTLVKPNELESSESEIESDNETDKIKEVIPIKRKLSQNKAVKRPKFIKQMLPNVSQSNKEKVSDVFDNICIQQRKIEVKVTSECLDNKVQDSVESVGSFGILEVAQKEVVVAEEKEEIQKETVIISEEELAANRIPLKDLSVLAIFKDYHPGVPSCRLYIKNIAKSVEKADLEFIYKRYLVLKGDDVPSQFDIRLMQEGRMKGQAFITMENLEAAQKALKETNGYILKDKPLVVVFARSAAPKK